MTTRSAAKAAGVFGAVAIVLVGAAFAWVRYSPRRVPRGQPPLSTLGPGSLAEFRDAFNAGEGSIRVLAMLSPT